ncbi:MAG: cupin domain-containing protein [Flavobacterium sp.]|nr:cupin domain-containing protein [Flavobacterium sp.]
MSESKMFFENKSTLWETIDENIERQIVGHDQSVMMVNVHFKKGGIGAMHRHIHSQVTHIAEGKFEVTINNEMKLLQKGDSFYVAPNLEHGVVCLEDGLLIDVFSPMREDFIKA